jgi:SAM-dependent methyltransferase
VSIQARTPDLNPGCAAASGIADERHYLIARIEKPLGHSLEVFQGGQEVLRHQPPYLGQPAVGPGLREVGRERHFHVSVHELQGPINVAPIPRLVDTAHDSHVLLGHVLPVSRAQPVPWWLPSHSDAVLDVYDHWEAVYSDKDATEVSWYEATPAQSLRLIAEAELPLDAAILDMGGGASKLAAELVKLGYSDVTVADISESGLRLAQRTLAAPDAVRWVEADVREHDFGRTFDLWHDRAVFHFMVEETDRDAYLDVLRKTLSPRGHLVVATFGPNGPTRCSGLPVTRYGPEDLSELLPDFKPVSSQLAVHRTPAGNPQEFLYAHLVRVEASS